jgi:hypothetical protein
MKKNLLLLLLFGSSIYHAQTSAVQLKNVVVVAQMENAEDRYTIEVNMTEMLTAMGVKALPSLNALKTGSPVSLLAGDSIQKTLQGKGYDTYMLLSVRGYDRRYKPSQCQDDLQAALGVANLYPIYRDEIVSVSFEFLFFRSGKCIASDVIKCGNVSDRESVLKRFRKSLSKHIVKNWL